MAKLPAPKGGGQKPAGPGNRIIKGLEKPTLPRPKNGK